MGLKPLRQRPGERGPVAMLDAESGRWTTTRPWVSLGSVVRKVEEAQPKRHSGPTGSLPGTFLQ